MNRDRHRWGYDGPSTGAEDFPEQGTFAAQQAAQARLSPGARAAANARREAAREARAVQQRPLRVLKPPPKHRAPGHGGAGPWAPYPVPYQGPNGYDGAATAIATRDSQLIAPTPGYIVDVLTRYRAQSAPLYQDPSTTSPVVAMIPHGTRVSKLEQRGDWCRVQLLPIGWPYGYPFVPIQPSLIGAAPDPWPAAMFIEQSSWPYPGTPTPYALPGWMPCEWLRTIYPVIE